MASKSSLKRNGPTTRGQIDKLMRRLQKTDDVVERMWDFICESRHPVRTEDMPAREDKLQTMLREYKEHESLTHDLREDVEKTMLSCPEQHQCQLFKYHTKLFKTERFAKIGDMLEEHAAVYEKWRTHHETDEESRAQLQKIQDRLSSSNLQKEVLQIIEEVRVSLGNRREEATSLSRRMQLTKLCIKVPVSKRCTSLQEKIQELDRLYGELESMAQMTLPAERCKVGAAAGYPHDSTGHINGENCHLHRRAQRIVKSAMDIFGHTSGPPRSSFDSSTDDEAHPTSPQQSDAADCCQKSKPELFCQPQEDDTSADLSILSSPQCNSPGTVAGSPLNIGHVNKVAITVYVCAETESEDSPNSSERDDSVFDFNSLPVSPTTGLPVNIDHAERVVINLTNVYARFDWTETSQKASEQQKQDKGHIQKFRDDIRRLSRKIETDIEEQNERDTELISQIDQLVKDREKKEEHSSKLSKRECVVIYYLKPNEEDLKALHERQTSLKDKELECLALSLYERFTIRLLAISQDFVFFLDVPYIKAQTLIINLSIIQEMIQEVLLKDVDHIVPWQPLSVCKPWDIWKMGKRPHKQLQKGSRKDNEGDDWRCKTTNMQCSTERPEALLRQENQQVERKETQTQELQSKVSEKTEREFTLERLTSLLEKEKEEGASKDELIKELQARLEREQESVAASNCLIEELKNSLSEAASLQAQLHRERDEERKVKNKELEQFIQLIKEKDGRCSKLAKQLQENKYQDAQQQLEKEQLRKTSSELEARLQKSLAENNELGSLFEKEKEEGASKDELIKELQARLSDMKDLQVQESVAASNCPIQAWKETEKDKLAKENEDLKMQIKVMEKSVKSAVKRIDHLKR